MAIVTATKAAILEVLAATPDLATVDRRWAPPTEGEDYAQEPEAVFFDTTEFGDDWSALGAGAGAGRRQKTYRITIVVLVAQSGDDPQATEERAEHIWELVEDALRTDVFAGPASILRAAGVQQFDDINGTQGPGVWGPNQWAARVDGRVTFTATSTS
jgi:hypothetical protein